MINNKQRNLVQGFIQLINKEVKHQERINRVLGSGFLGHSLRENYSHHELSVNVGFTDPIRCELLVCSSYLSSILLPKIWSFSLKISPIRRIESTSLEVEVQRVT